MTEQHDHEHEDAQAHGHEHPKRRLRGLVASVVGHSHDPGDSIDDALTSDARGIRALKISLLVLGATAAAQLVVVLLRAACST